VQERRDLRLLIIGPKTRCNRFLDCFGSDRHKISRSADEWISNSVGESFTRPNERRWKVLCPACGLAVPRKLIAVAVRMYLRFGAPSRR
jgi:hypothetical protein